MTEEFWIIRDEKEEDVLYGGKINTSLIMPYWDRIRGILDENFDPSAVYSFTRIISLQGDPPTALISNYKLHPKRSPLDYKIEDGYDLVDQQRLRLPLNKDLLEFLTRY